MSELLGNSEHKLEEIGELVNSSFIDLKCLRCGFDEFAATDVTSIGNFLIDAQQKDSLGPVVVLACTRCGFVEQHLTESLRNATKPIPRD